MTGSSRNRACVNLSAPDCDGLSLAARDFAHGRAVQCSITRDATTRKGSARFSVYSQVRKWFGLSRLRNSAASITAGKRPGRQTRLDFHDFCDDVDVELRGEVDAGDRTCNQIGASATGHIVVASRLALLGRRGELLGRRRRPMRTSGPMSMTKAQGPLFRISWRLDSSGRPGQARVALIPGAVRPIFMMCPPTREGV
jgi:hypothetical protein